MLELKLIITGETTLDDLRAFVKVTADAPGDAPIISFDWHDEMDGIAAVISPQAVK